MEKENRLIMQRSLTQGPITRNMLLFALPLMCGNLLQQMYNIADTWVVGRFLGADALAAVGSSYTLMTFLTSIVLGLCMGSGAVISMQYGGGEEARMRQSVFQSFALIAGISLAVNLLVYLGLNGILWVLRVPVEIRPLMKQYLVMIFGGIFATFLYNYFANLLRAIGNSMVPLVFLAVSSILNVVLDLVCVLVLHHFKRKLIILFVFPVCIRRGHRALYLKAVPGALPPAGRLQVGQAQSGNHPESVRYDQRPAVHHELWHPDGAGSCQQFWHGHHGGLCSGGQN